MVIDSLLSALHTIFSLDHFVFIILGLVVGLLSGLIPGLSGVTCILMLLPFLAFVEPSQALALIASSFAVTSISDSFSSILLGVPGTASSQATIVDGHPLAKQGKPYEALGAAFSSSFIGGLIGALCLSVFIFYAKPVVLAFTVSELFMLCFLGLTFVGLLHRENSFKGICAVFLGLVLGTVGSSVLTGEHRFTFGSWDLYEGINPIPLALGIFAIPEILSIFTTKTSPISNSHSLTGVFYGIKETLKNKWIVFRCSLLGTFVGAIPGIGGSVIDWLAYGVTSATVKDNSNFGRGDIRGVIGPESANTAKEGGSLIPTLLFGIPGSGTMVVFLLALDYLDMYPSITFIHDHLNIVYTIVWSVILAVLFGSIICLLFSKLFIKFLTIKYYLLAPILFLVVSLSVYFVNESYFDLLCLYFFSVIGIVLKKEGWSRPALLLGFILSNNIEKYFYQAIEIYGFEMFTRPITLLIILFTALGLYKMRHNKDTVNDKSFLLFPMCFFFITYSVSIWNTDFLTNIFPLFCMTSFFLYLGVKKAI